MDTTNTRTHPGAALLAIWVIAGASCGGEHPALTGTTIVIRARNDYDLPVPQVAVKINRTDIGLTDFAGELRARLSGVEGTSFAIQATCPDAHEMAAPLPKIVLGRYGAVGGRPDADFEIAVPCKRRRRAVAVLVRARQMSRPNAATFRRGGKALYGSAADAARQKAFNRSAAITVSALAGVPLLYNGRTLASTDGSGLAHLALDVPAKGNLVLTFDTSGEPLRRLRPRSPSVNLEVKDEDDIYLVDQPFAYDRPPPDPSKRHVIKILEGGMDGRLIDLPRW